MLPSVTEFGGIPVLLSKIYRNPNLFPEYSTHIDFLKRVGEAIIKKSKDLKKKNNIK